MIAADEDLIVEERDENTASAELSEAFKSMPPEMLKLWHERISNGYCKLNSHYHYLLRMYASNPDIPRAVKVEAELYRTMREEQYELERIIAGAMYSF